MRDQLAWAVILAVQYVVFVRVVRPWLLRQLAPLAEMMALLSILIPPTR